MSKAIINCPECEKEVAIKKSVLIPYFGKKVKLKCQNPECNTIFYIEVNEEFAALVDLFPKVKSERTIIEIRGNSNENKTYSAYLIDLSTEKKYQLLKGLT